ncbi:MAG: tetratricopeptide repeat protein [Chlamydiales bacterium]|nr:tetratricopeptide repeat protein [Chlamydiales bacterium]
MKKMMLVLILNPFFILHSLFAAGSKSKLDSDPSPDYVQEYNAGVKAQKEKDYKTAIQYYQKALDQKSDFSDAWNNLGYCYRMVAKSYLSQAGDAYEKAVNYNPKHEQALEYQGEYFVMMGELKDAYGNYKKLKEMNSDESNPLKEKLDRVLKQAQSVLKGYSP